MFVLVFLVLHVTHAAHGKSVGTEFTIQGGGKFDAGKLVMDIHVEATNATANATTTVAPTTEPTSPAASTPVQTPTPKPTPTPTTRTPTDVTSGSNAATEPPKIKAPTTAPPTTEEPTTAPPTTEAPTTAPPTTAAATTLGTTSSVNGATTPAAGTKATTGPGEGVSVTNPTPAPEFKGRVNVGVFINFSDLDRTALQLHNYYRSIHEAPLLSLDKSLKKDAQEYADRVAKNQLLRPELDFLLKSKNEGENLGFRCSVTRPDPAKALRQIMKRWYDEGCKYDFNRPQSDRYNYRHFTQLTWQGTRRLGVGISYGKVKNLQCLYFVARYSPRGNNGDTFTYSDNVKKGVFDPSFCKPVPNQPANQEVVLKRMIN